MARFRDHLPQLEGGLFLADGGIETDLIFNHDITIREFATHTLLPEPAGRRAVADYFRPYIALARELGAGFVLDSQTWKAHRHWASALGATAAELEAANHDAIAFLAELRRAAGDDQPPVVLNGIIGPRGDAYAPEANLAVAEAEAYHAEQLRWLAATDVDMVTATTFTQADEAAGLVRAARAVGLPAVVSFTVETDGRLPSGQPLGEAVAAVDAATDGAAAYFMVNCAHPVHFAHVLEDSPWARRIRGLRCNASRKSHAELDESTTLDAGDPAALATQYVELLRTMPWVHILGGCCGTDLRHVTAIARAVGR